MENWSGSRNRDLGGNPVVDNTVYKLADRPGINNQDCGQGHRARGSRARGVSPTGRVRARRQENWEKPWNWGRTGAWWVRSRQEANQTSSVCGIQR